MDDVFLAEQILDKALKNSILKATSICVETLAPLDHLRHHFKTTRSVFSKAYPKQTQTIHQKPMKSTPQWHKSTKNIPKVHQNLPKPIKSSQVSPLPEGYKTNLYKDTKQACRLLSSFEPFGKSPRRGEVVLQSPVRCFHFGGPETWQWSFPGAKVFFFLMPRPREAVQPLVGQQK